MNKIYSPNKAEWNSILKRPTKTVADIEATVLAIFEAVRNNGDTAVGSYTEKFDNVKLESNQVTSDEIANASALVSDDLKAAIQLAKSNIEKFHSAQKSNKVALETTLGVECWQEKRPIQKVGLYIPGGTAPLFSTILMLAIPANIAGCKEIVLCSPPDKNTYVASLKFLK